MAMAEAHKSNTGKYVVVYLCILAIAALQFVIAYSNITASQMFTRMLFLAIVEAALALLFFMHLSDNRGLNVVCRNLYRVGCCWACNMVGPTASGCSEAPPGPSDNDAVPSRKENER